VGKTTMGPRGDAIVEADWCVGELLAHLKKEGLLEKTLIIFSSDNGPVLNDGYKDGAPELAGDHLPAGGLRGGKYSLFDGGTHIPLFVYWKGKIQPVVSDALVCQVDILASLGSMIHADLPEGLDSRNYKASFYEHRHHTVESYIKHSVATIFFAKLLEKILSCYVILHMEIFTHLSHCIIK
jgi:arylsulfatase A-like enzyme